MSVKAQSGDLDAMTAYDEAEQELYGDRPVIPIPSSRVQGAEEGSCLHPDGSNVMVNGDEEVSPLGPDDSNSPAPLGGFSSRARQFLV